MNLYNKGTTLRGIDDDNTERGRQLARLAALSPLFSDLDDNDLAVLALRDLMSNKSTAKFSLQNHVVEELGRVDDSDLLRYLRYRYAYEVYPRDYVLSSYPPVVQIEPTSVCNFRCIFCYQTDRQFTSKANGHMGHMSLELFRSIVDQLEGNVEAITLASRGEPTVNKLLPEMLDYLKGKFLAVKINTNAHLLNEDIARAILDADIQTLVFSADAASEPNYSRMRVNGKLERTLRNVENFSRIKEQHYPNSKLITRVSGVKYDSDQDFDELKSFWERFVDQVAFVDYNPWENVYESEKKLIGQACSDLWRRMFIWWDGSVNCCDVDYRSTLMAENVNEKSISAIWTGGRYSFLRDSHLSQRRAEIEPCSRCVVV